MIAKIIHQCSVSASLLVVCSGVAQAKVELPSFFSDGMVLQQGKGAKVWGTTDPSSVVMVDFAGQSEKATSDAQGRWSVTFDGLKASNSPQDLTLTSGDDKQLIKDVLVGEVWLASGQSNMEWLMTKTDGAEEAKTANDNLLRVYVSGNVAIGEAQKDFKGTWKSTKPGNTETFTSVGYQFAKRLRAELNVPVGIIECSWGGKPVESFISEEALAKLPEAKVTLARKQKQQDEYQRALTDHAQKTAEYKKQLAQWETEKEGPQPAAPAKLKASNPNRNANVSSTIYNGMIAPLVGYGARGAIWYQGETNAFGRANFAEGVHYEEFLACLVHDWRARWGSELSFYYVQLANFKKASVNAGTPSHWATVQDEQRQMLYTVKNVGMAVTNDIGNATDIHPKNKTEVGARLARWALHHDYGKKEVVVSGPLYRKMETAEGKAMLEFDFSKGLKSRDGKPLQRFEIAGADGVWHWADAKIMGESVVVSSTEVAEPVKVRYAWADNPAGANLVNAEGLPTSCFTTEKK